MANNKERLTITLSPQIKESLLDICEVQGITASAFVSMAIVRELKENSVFQLTHLAASDRRKKQEQQEKENQAKNIK